MRHLLAIAALTTGLLLGPFTAPAFAGASNYCVEMPTSGNSRWSRRDNDVKLRFSIRYAVRKEVNVNPASLVPNWQMKTFHERIRVNGPSYVGRDAGYRSFRYGAGRQCLDMSRIKPMLQHYEDSKRLSIIDMTYAHNPSSQHYYRRAQAKPVISNITVQGDVRWGKDCPKVGIAKSKTFKVYRRRHNHADPWGCR